MPDCLHMFKGYRVPPETVERLKQAIIETQRRVDVSALQAMVRVSMVPVDPWPNTTLQAAAAFAVDSFLFDAVRAGLVTRHSNAWRFPAWYRAKTRQGAA